MTIRTNLWRAQKGTSGIIIVKLCFMNIWFNITKGKFHNSFVLSFFYLITFLSLLLIFSNDVELNLGPKKDSSKRNFSIAHLNLNNIVAQNFVKLSQLEAWNTLHSYYLIAWDMVRLYNFHRFQWFVSEGLHIVLTILTILKKQGFVITIQEALAVHL